MRLHRQHTSMVVSLKLTCTFNLYKWTPDAMLMLGVYYDK